MQQTFYVSDTHFSHTSIIKYCNRPFEDYIEMNDTMIKNWNEVVSKNDLVYHLGDFAFHSKPEDIDKLIEQLNGKIILIKGNHDHKKTINKCKNFHSVLNDYIGTIDGIDIHAYHYPLISWNKQRYGCVHLHGHVHGALDSKRLKNSYDIGVDSNNFTPLTLPQIMNNMDYDIDAYTN